MAGLRGLKERTVQMMDAMAAEQPSGAPLFFTSAVLVPRLRDAYPDYQRLNKAALKLQLDKLLAKLGPTRGPAGSTAAGSKRPRAEEAAKPRSLPLTAAQQAAAVAPPKADADAKAARRQRKQRRTKEGTGKEAEADAAVEQAVMAAMGRRVSAAARPEERLADMGGIDDVIQQLVINVGNPLVHPNIYAAVGAKPPRGVLLHGPPGCGKTTLAHAVAGEVGCAFYKVSAPEVVTSRSGDSELKLRRIFEEAAKNAPAIIFIDDVDVIAAKDASRGMERRIVAQLQASMDDLAPEKTGGRPVIVLAATSKPDSIDAALRRSGRFDKEICLTVPDETARLLILQKHTDKMKLSQELDLRALVRQTPGFVGADLESLAKQAALIAVDRFFRARLGGEAAADAATGGAHPKDNDMCDEDGDEELGEAPQAAEAAPAAVAAAFPNLDAPEPFDDDDMDALAVTPADFEAALKRVQASGTREGFATVPDVSWADIGALDSIREELMFSLVRPIRNPEEYHEIGLQVPAGVLLWGPPGCGKTLLAKAIAHESGANFISVKGPELLDKYVGESEAAVRGVFTAANASAPCIVFFDEFDALAPRRGSGGGGGGVSERVVNQLLTELDGLEARRHVFVIAATNRPDMIDAAMLRPGRLDKLLYVQLPTEAERASILTKHVRKVPLRGDVDLSGIAARSDGFSGADLAGLVRQASTEALRERWKLKEAAEAAGQPGPTAPLCVTAAHFDEAFNRVTPSVSAKSQRDYERMRKRMSQARASLTRSGRAVGLADEAVAGAATPDGDGGGAGAAAAPASAAAAAATNGAAPAPQQ